MIKIKQLYDNLIDLETEIKQLHKRELKNYKDYDKYDNEINILYKTKESVIILLHKELEKNINIFCKTNYKTGVVWTKFEEDILKGNFMIWIDKGFTIEHNFFNLKEVI